MKWISMAVAASLFSAFTIGGAQTQCTHFGVNLSGAEFGGEVPGEFGRAYTYPTPEILDYYKAQGRTRIRLPFRWKRMQRGLNEPLNSDELGRLRGVLRAAGARKMKVILDLHSYGRYEFPGGGEDKTGIIGSERVPLAAFADFWRRLASAVKDDAGLGGYGLMNEPHDMGDDVRWPRAAQAAIEAIRQVDPKAMIFVPGDGWSSSRSWCGGSNETLNQKVHDPSNQLTFEAHCYFDKNLSGSYQKTYEGEETTPNKGVDNVRPFVEWCLAKKVRGFVGEFGVPDSDTRWLVTMDRFLNYLNRNGISATYWAGGPWWGPYPLAIEPQQAPAPAVNWAPATDGVPKTPELIDRPQMLILRQYHG